jgi:uncharacterized damage-inducible protein DinB
MRVERGAFGLPPEEEDAYPLELPPDHWSLSAADPAAEQHPHPPDVPAAHAEEEGEMPTFTTVDALIEELSRRRQTLLEAVAGLSDEQLDRAGVVGEWSIENILAHLADQDDVLARVTPERLRTGEKPAEVLEMNADADAYNARRIAASAALSPRGHLAELAEARERLVATIRELGDEALARRRPWPEWPDTLAEYFLIHVGDHEGEHAEAIHAAAEKLQQDQSDGRAAHVE